jgi:hypothetical protein
MTEEEERIVRLEVRLQGTREDLREIKDDAKATRADVAAIRSKIDRAEGGWRALLAVSSASAGLGAVVMKAIDWAR